MAFILDDIAKGFANRIVAKEQKKTNEKNLQADFESRSAAERNAEDSRLARANALSTQLQGNRALSPEVIKAILTRKAVTTRKGAMADPSKGVMWGAMGNALGSAGDLGLALLSGLGSQKILGGAENPNKTVASIPTRMGGFTQMLGQAPKPPRTDYDEGW